MRKYIYGCSIDYKNAFDKVDQTRPLRLLQDKGLNNQDIKPL